jgi:hypothetical protein
MTPVANRSRFRALAVIVPALLLFAAGRRRQPGAGHCGVVAATGGKAEPEAVDRVQGIPLPSRLLEKPPGG